MCLIVIKYDKNAGIRKNALFNEIFPYTSCSKKLSDLIHFVWISNAYSNNSKLADTWWKFKKMKKVVSASLRMLQLGA